ncbi:MAG: hypothetical protein F6K55_29950 [Moorea sp. SIO4A3]|nr:hypothetical protein [Moorena sp. SIO4A3]
MKVGRLAGWQVESWQVECWQVECWQVGRLAGWQVGRLAGWQVGRLNVGKLTAFVKQRMISSIVGSVTDY